MPVEVVDIDLTAETGAIPQPTFTDALAIGTSLNEPSGDVELNEAALYSELSEVADDFGEDADVTVASEAIKSMDASSWRVIQLEAFERTESLDGSELDNAPILGTPTPELETEDELVFTTETAPDIDEFEEADAVLNTDTGEYDTDDESLELTYQHVDWTELGDLIPDDVNRAAMADRQMGVEHIGTLNSLVSWASGRKVGVVAAGKDGSTFESDTAALEHYQETFSYVPSGDLLAVAHKSGADVSATILGQLAINDPWFNPFFDGSGYPFNTDFYRNSLVGKPETSGTFEGGTDDEQEGAVNVVINKAGTQVLSNSITTAGSGSDYQFFDVGRTQDFLGAEVRRSLTSLRLRKDQIPFTDSGRDQIINTIRQTISQYVGGGGPLADFSVTVPPRDELTDDEVANRVWSGIEIEAVLAGNVHEFSVELRVTI